MFKLQAVSESVYKKKFFSESTAFPLFSQLSSIPFIEYIQQVSMKTNNVSNNT